MQKPRKSLKEKISYLVFRAIRALVRLFYPKIRVFGWENVPDEPCILVGNHSQMHGPIMAELYIPGDRAIWCAGQMMKCKEVPAYAYQDFWSGKPRWIRWFYKILSYVIAPLSACVFQNAHTIAVWRDNRIISTFRSTVKALEEGKNVVVFPEHYEPHNQIINHFQENFVDVAKLYCKRAGKDVCFVPVYLAPNLKAMYVGSPVPYRREADAAQERHRVCTELMQAITDMAQSLPEHTVVPYANVSRKLYKKNIPEDAQ